MQAPPIGPMDGTGRAPGKPRQHPAVVGSHPVLACFQVALPGPPGANDDHD